MLNIGFYLLFAGFINLQVSSINQLPNYPTGCESVACVVVLNYLGCDITVEEFVNKLPKVDKYYEGVFDEAFLGNPKDATGVICYEEPLISVIDNIDGYRGVNMQDTDFVDLLDDLMAGYPVVLWVTQGYVKPFDTGLGYCTPSHTVVWHGVDMSTGTALVADSLYGEIQIDILALERIYEDCGRHALVIKYE